MKRAKFLSVAQTTPDDPKVVKAPEIEHIQQQGKYYRATLEKKYSMWFLSEKEAEQVYQLAMKYDQFWKLNFPDYMK
jgi:hypothetical protein